MSFPLLAVIGLVVMPVSTQQNGFVPLGPVEPRLPGLERRVEQALAGSLEQVLQQLAAAADLRLTFASELPGLATAVSRPGDRATIRSILRELLAPTGLDLLVAQDGRAVLARRALAPEASAAGIVWRGVVRDAATGAPIRFASVRTADGRGALTDAAGTFLVAAPAGSRLQARAVGYTPHQLDLPAATADTVEIAAITLERAPVRLPDLVVTPSTFRTAAPAVSAAAVPREALESTTQIGEDVYRAINRLPGIDNNDNTAAFGVRGGTHDELYVSLDGLLLVEPFHLKDFNNALSIVDAQTVSSVELITGGFPARYGNRLTGVLTLSSVDHLPGPDRRQLGLSIGNVRALASGEYGEDRGSWLVSVRRGYLDLILALADPSSEVRPRYLDVFAKTTYRLTPRLALSFHTLAAHDDLNFDGDDEDPRIDSKYSSAYGWARLQTIGAGRFRAQAVASIGRLTWTRLGERFADFDGAQDLFVDDRRRLVTAELRAEAGYLVAPWVLASVGFDGRIGTAHYEYANWQRYFAYTTVTGFVPRWDSTTVSRDVDGREGGGFASLRVQPLPATTLEAGLRVDGWSVIDETIASPRVQLVQDIGSRTSLRAAWGRYSQAQNLHQLQVQDGIDRFAPAERAEHRIVGVDQAIGDRGTLRIEAFERLLDHQRPRFVNLDDGEEVFPELEYDRTLLAPSEGRVRGVEATVRGIRAPASWSVSYRWQRSENRVDGTWVPRPLDQRHTGNLDLEWELSRRTHVSAAYVFHSGWPYTDAAFDIDTLAGGFTVLGRATGPLYAERFPAYHRIDVRVTRDFPLSRGRLRAFLEIFNLLNRENPHGFSVRPALDENGFLARTVRFTEDLYPRVYAFGVYWEF